MASGIKIWQKFFIILLFFSGFKILNKNTITEIIIIKWSKKPANKMAIDWITKYFFLAILDCF